MTSMNSGADWPELPLAGWIDTRDTLHRWLQIVGKLRLEGTPWTNHSWHVVLYVTARGLTTSPIPYGSVTSVPSSPVSTICTPGAGRPHDPGFRS